MQARETLPTFWKQIIVIVGGLLFFSVYHPSPNLTLCQDEYQAQTRSYFGDALCHLRLHELRRRRPGRT